MEMAVRSMETMETAMETDGDGSEGTSLSRQGAGTETSVPQNLSSMAAALRNCSRKNTDCFRVFHREAFYRRRGIVRRRPGGPTQYLLRDLLILTSFKARKQGSAARGWAAPPHGEAGPWPPSGYRSVFDTLSGNIGLLKLVLSNSENISCVDFLKHKNSRK
jgi:hypothetical protein